MITTLRYSATNTYLITGSKGKLLFDTGWAGTLPAFFHCLGENGIKAQDITLLVISHFHPDHMGIAQQIADLGVTLAAADVQRDFLHASDSIFAKDKRSDFVPIDDSNVRFFTTDQSRSMLAELGISGEIIHTPGHSDDSISLWLDDEKALFVGDLNPLYELDAHKGTPIAQSWEKLLALKPKTVYYAHAKTAQLGDSSARTPELSGTDIYALVKKIIRLNDKGCTAETVCKKTGADIGFVSDVRRMYVTHPGVDVQGILDRIEIKGK